MFLKKGSILELVDSKHLGKYINIDEVDFKDLSYAMLRITVVKKSFNNKLKFRGVIIYTTDKRFTVGDVFETNGRSKLERLDLNSVEYLWHNKANRDIVALELRHYLYKTLCLKEPIKHPHKYFNRDNRVGQFYTLIKITESINYYRNIFLENRNKYRLIE